MVLVWLQTKTKPKPYQNHTTKQYWVLVWFWSRTGIKFEPKTNQKSMNTASIFSCTVVHKVRNYWFGFWFVFGSNLMEAEPKPYQTYMCTYVPTYIMSTMVLYAIFFKSYQKLTFAETVVVLFMYVPPTCYNGYLNYRIVKYGTVLYSIERFVYVDLLWIP